MSGTADSVACRHARHRADGPEGPRPQAVDAADLPVEPVDDGVVALDPLAGEAAVVSVAAAALSLPEVASEDVADVDDDPPLEADVPEFPERESVR